MWKALSWAFEQDNLRPVEKLLLITLAQLSTQKGYAFCSQAYLCHALNVSGPTLRQAIKSLEGLDMIRRQTHQKIQGGRRNDTYHLPPEAGRKDMDELDQLADLWDTQNRAAANPPEPPNRKKLSVVKPALTAEPKKTFGKGGKKLSVPYNDDNSKSIEGSLCSPSIVGTSEITPELIALWNRNHGEAFKWFWHNFPKTRRQDKIACCDKFLRIINGKHKTLKATAPEIVIGAIHYSERVNHAFARMPMTWINNGNWKPEENYGVNTGAAKPTGITQQQQRGAIARALSDELEDYGTPAEGNYATEARRRAARS